MSPGAISTGEERIEDFKGAEAWAIEASTPLDVLQVEAQSPFLPGTAIQFAWDSTSLGYLKTCPRLYQYTMIEGWSSRGDNVHLRFGIEYHAALQDYDLSRANGISHDDAVHDTLRALLTRVADWDPDPQDGKRSEALKTKPNLVRTVLWYLDKFKDDPAETVILDDGRPAVELSFRFELEYGPSAGGWRVFEEQDGDARFTYTPYVLCGHLDRVVRFNDELFIMDRKTTSTTPSSYYFNQFEPNNQMSLYTIASQIVVGSPVRGVIIDAAQIGQGFSRFVRGMTYRTQDQLDEWLLDLRHWLGLAEQYATAGYWPQNDTACDKFGGCRFREICSKSPQVRQQFLKGNFEKGEPWNPLKTRG